jgi:hypothetical protein
MNLLNNQSGESSISNIISEWLLSTGSAWRDWRFALKECEQNWLLNRVKRPDKMKKNLNSTQFHPISFQQRWFIRYGNSYPDDKIWNHIPHFSRSR